MGPRTGLEAVRRKISFSFPWTEPIFYQLPASNLKFPFPGGGGKDGLRRPKYVKNFNYVERDTVQECCIYSWKSREGETLSNSKTRQNKDINNTNGLVSSYRNIRRILKQRISMFSAADWKGFTRNTASTPEETPRSSWPRRLMITQLQCSCYAYNPPGTYSFSVKARNNSSISREVRRCVHWLMIWILCTLLRWVSSKCHNICSSTPNIIKITWPISNNFIKPTWSVYTVDHIRRLNYLSRVFWVLPTDFRGPYPEPGDCSP